MAASAEIPGRRRWGWGRWLLLALTLVGWAPTAFWAAGLILADHYGCRIGGSAAPCQTPFGDIGTSLYGMTMAGGWLMIPAALIALPTGLAWAVIFFRWVFRRSRGRTGG
ncbi:hypothetical protein SAMN02745194_00452 [Roseomonas rosea]|uniref:Vitamin K epoxide reductase family protein n=1 Tax=Muricoccus roseus TaxID=198092 RepID=A0A1M6BD36_9PROT|nr:hypothetical protein [Roseomonas rosea]SHI46664.1 hypothetical protein SAMN02745194_00452 [Roseomonas rosea]